jgi:outer membrane protein TolC
MKTSILSTLSLGLLAALAARAQGVPESAGGAMTTLPDRLDLPAAVHYALDHNYAILTAREQIRQQEGVILQVKAQGLPNLAATGGYQRNSSAISQTGIPSSSLWTIEAKATQALYAGGGIDASVRGAKLTRDAALFDLQSTVDTALLDVRTRFYAVLLAREQVGVQEENVKLAERQLQDTQNQFHAGSVSNFEVLRAQVALANAQPDLITARNNYRISIEQLRQALGVPAGIGASATFSEVVGTLDFTPAKVDPDTALASAHEHRPELLRIERQRAAAEQSVKGAKSNYYPTLSVYGGYETGGAELVPYNNNAGGYYGASGWLAGLSSTWSIFDGRATAGKVQQALAVLNQNQLAYASEELAIDVEVRQALSSLQEAEELVDASQKTVGQAEEALRLATERFHAGAATQLDVLTSQTALTQTRTNQLQANYNYLVAVATLRKAMGLGDALIKD